MIQYAGPKRKAPASAHTSPQLKPRRLVALVVGTDVDRAVMIAHEETETRTTICLPDWDHVERAAMHVDVCFVLGADATEETIQEGWNAGVLLPGQSVVLLAPPHPAHTQIDARAQAFGVPVVTLHADDLETLVFDLLARTGIKA